MPVYLVGEFEVTKPPGLEPYRAAERQHCPVKENRHDRSAIEHWRRCSGDGRQGRYREGGAQFSV